MINKGKKRITRGEKLGMIWGCEKTDGCRMNINSLDFVLKQRLKGFLEILIQRSWFYNGVKKNGVRMLWDCSPEFLRSEDATDSGFVLRQEADLLGGGNPAGILQAVWLGEARDVELAFEECVDDPTVCFLCGSQMPGNDNSRCRQGRKTGLANGQGFGQALYAGAVETLRDSGAPSNRHRRNFVEEGTHVPDCGKRSGAAESNLVWRQRPLGRKPGFILPVAEPQEIKGNKACGHGHVESFREIDEEECAEGRHSLRQVSCDPAFGRSLGQNSETGICASVRKRPEFYQRSEIYVAFAPGKSDAGRPPEFTQTSSGQ